MTGARVNKPTLIQNSFLLFGVCLIPLIFHANGCNSQKTEMLSCFQVKNRKKRVMMIESELEYPK